VNNEADISLAVGHSTLLTNILQGRGAKQCKYRYNFETVQEFVQFCAVLTRFGESGVYGFLSHLDSRPAATLLLQSITTEARQQMIFRQFAGKHYLSRVLWHHAYPCHRRLPHARLV
jgi:hypothetical protein